eukprot:3759164-Rhodomonas_salina.2
MPLLSSGCSSSVHCTLSSHHLTVWVGSGRTVAAQLPPGSAEEAAQQLMSAREEHMHFDLSSLQVSLSHLLSSSLPPFLPPSSFPPSLALRRSTRSDTERSAIRMDCSRRFGVRACGVRAGASMRARAPGRGR